MQAPKLDNRNSTVIVEQALKLAKIYVTEQEWKGLVDKNEPGRGLIDIFARLMEILIERLNRIPDKNFLSFLDMVGVEQKPPSPAEVPVTFLLSKAAQAGGEIPECTQVATTQTEKADAQVFETRKTFFATPAELKKVINLLPKEDQYSKLELIDIPPKPEDLEDESSTITALSGDMHSFESIDHILCLGSEALFGRKEIIQIELTFSLENSHKNIFSKSNLEWKKKFNKEEDDWEKIDVIDNDYNKSMANEVKVTLREFAGTEKTDLNGKKDYWIACHFVGDFEGLLTPKISNVTGKVSTPAGQPITSSIESAFFNLNPIDLSKPFYPFGERPKYGDAFYIGNKEAFSREVNKVTLTFTILPYTDPDIEYKFKNMKAGNTKVIETIIKWQYLDDDELWQNIVKFRHKVSITKNADSTFAPIVHETYKDDDTNQITDKNGAFFCIANNPTISTFDFNIPPDIRSKKLFEQGNYWIRALIINSDPYGENAYYESTTDPNHPYVVIGPTFIPPIIENVEVTIDSYKADQPIPVEAIQTKNNFSFVDHSGKVELDESYSFQPFIPITSHEVNTNGEFFAEEPAIYMGFDRPFGDVFISMFVHLKNIVSKEVFPLETGFPQIVWEYVSQVNGNINWKPLDVQDGTANLTSSGTVDFLGPNDSGKIRTFDLLAEAELYWYRARLKEGAYDHPPQVKGIHLNTVMAALHCLIKRPEIRTSNCIYHIEYLVHIRDRAF